MGTNSKMGSSKKEGIRPTSETGLNRLTRPNFRNFEDQKKCEMPGTWRTEKKKCSLIGILLLFHFFFQHP